MSEMYLRTRHKERTVMIARVLFGTALLAGMLAAAACSSVVSEPRTTAYNEPLNAAESLALELSANSADIVINPLDSGDALMNAQIDHLGDLRYDVTGTASRAISLREDGVQNVSYIGRPMRWSVDLNRAVPLSLTISGGSSDLTLPLAAFSLRALEVNTGSGGINLTLPASDSPIPLQVSSGSGLLIMTVVENAQVSFDSLSLSSGEFAFSNMGTASVNGSIRLGSGDVTINLAPGITGELAISVSSGDIRVSQPEGMALRIDVRSASSGEVEMGDVLRRLSASGLTENTGTWETPGFDEAEQQFTLIIESGSGDIRVE